MFWDGLLTRRLDAFLTNLRADAVLPLAVELWNGQRYELGAPVKVTLRVKRPAALKYLLQPSLDALAEGYVEGYFDVDGSLPDVIAVAAELARSTIQPVGRFGRVVQTVTHSKSLDAESIRHHYDVSNAFYARWLDERMVYSCAYYERDDMTLEQAQIAKLDHIVRKVRLRPGDRLLDIGCGWGALAIRAAEQGAKVLGVTLSRNQHDLARERVARAGLQDRVEIRLEDYRDVRGEFDRITSVGMFEHVGLKNLPTYFGRIRALLADGGLALNHGITSTDVDSGNTPYGAGAFIDKYVFPNGELPHVSLVLREMEAAGLETIDVESLRRHYARTLTEWSRRYEAQADALRPTVPDLTWRVWRVYLAGCAFGFDQYWMSIHQVLACKAGPGPTNPAPMTRRWMYPAG